MDTAAEPDLRWDFASRYNPPRSRYSSRNHALRANAKRLARSGQQDSTVRYVCDILGHPNPCPEADRLVSSDKMNSRAHIEHHLRSSSAFDNERRGIHYDSAPPVRRVRVQDEDDVELARSDVPLPGDFKELPSFQRQEAFVDPSTYKGNRHLRSRPASTDDAEVAELYRMGLLYDEQDRLDRSLHLNNISHDAPPYSIRVAKRSRKPHRPHVPADYDAAEPLHLDLSFADLGDDDAIARYLMSATAPSSSSSTSSFDMDMATAGEDSVQHRGRRSPRSSAPLRVIYELDGSSPSVDVDTSQPPDLVVDSLSDDYDCFSDSDMDDAPPQREVREDATAAPADTWVILGNDS